MRNSIRTSHRILCLLAIICLVATAVGCGNPRTSSLPLLAGKGQGLATNDAGTIASSAPSSTTEQTGSNEADITDRKIIFNAEVALDVTDVQKAFQNCQDLASKQGGYIAQSSLQKSDAAIVATLTARVPAGKLDAFLNGVSALGTVTKKSISSQDVTSQAIDIAARLKVLQAEEQQLLAFLRKATTIKDMLSVEQQLNSVRTQIEQYEGQQRYLDKSTSLATVTVELTQTIAQYVVPRGFLSAFQQSLVRFGHGVSACWTWFGGSLLFILFCAAILSAVLFGLVRLLRRLSRRKRARSEDKTPVAE